MKKVKSKWIKDPNGRNQCIDFVEENLGRTPHTLKVEAFSMIQCHRPWNGRKNKLLYQTKKLQHKKRMAKIKNCPSNIKRIFNIQDIKSTGKTMRARSKP